MELDSTAEEDLVAGRPVKRVIPLNPLATVPTVPRSTRIADYRSARSSATRLILPLLARPTGRLALFPYQDEGVKWLTGQTSAILADDMGLGKTAQTLRAILSLTEDGKCLTALAVVPRSLLATWEYEVARWTPTLTRLRVVPADSVRDDAWRAVLGRTHVIITTYEQMRSLPRAVLEANFDVLVADEAHRIRNMSARITQAFSRLTANRIWALSGTPLERDAADLRTLLAVVTRSRFAFRGPIPPAYVLRAEARPYLLRRRKQDVLTQLPDVIDVLEPLDLLPLQAKTYRSTLKEALAHLESPGDFLRLLNQLRAICDADPTTGASSKVERIQEIVEDIIAAGEKVVVFSYLLKPLELLASALAKSSPQARIVSLTGSMSATDREESIRFFREDPTCHVLLASLRVAGEGLTLTEANHVVFFNEWWNPSANAQARDRLVRIGQKRVVTVYRFRCRETIEENLDRILAEKSETFEVLIDRLADQSYSRDMAEVIQIIGRELKAEKAAGPN